MLQLNIECILMMINILEVCLNEGEHLISANKRTIHLLRKDQHLS